MTRKEYQNLFNNITDEKIERLKFLNPYLVASAKESDTSTSMNDPKLSATLQEIQNTMDEWAVVCYQYKGRNESGIYIYSK